MKWVEGPPPGEGYYWIRWQWHCNRRGESAQAGGERVCWWIPGDIESDDVRDWPAADSIGLPGVVPASLVTHHCPVPKPEET